MKRRAVVFVAPRQVELCEEDLADPGPGQVLVRTRISAISAGTELLAYRGQLPADLPVDETLGAFGGQRFSFPMRYGYAAVGEVIALGAGVEPAWRGRRVFAFQPHASHFVAAPGDLLAIPDALDAERAAFYAHVETAVNLLLDGEPRLGERVVVIGQGVVGLLTTALLARFPLLDLVALEAMAGRREASRTFGARCLAPDDDWRRELPAAGADLVFELSGNPAGLDLAIAAAGREARIVVGSWYGDKRHPVDLGGHFHRGRLRFISSQVSHLAPALGARWDRARRTAVAFAALASIDTRALVTHRFVPSDAHLAYRMLDERPGEALQVLFRYE